MKKVVSVDMAILLVISVEITMLYWDSISELYDNEDHCKVKMFSFIFSLVVDTM